MDHFPYLFAGYSVIIVAIFLYVILIGQRQSRLEAELSAMEARVKALDDAPAQEPAPPDAQNSG